MYCQSKHKFPTNLNMKTFNKSITRQTSIIELSGYKYILPVSANCPFNYENVCEAHESLCNYAVATAPPSGGRPRP